jgi:pimeloyl-ACP methyl ester carboxylesterase
MLYFVSGLGADERVFAHLKLPGIPFRHIRWITPLEGEDLPHYCSRLLEQIDTSQEVVLAGLSFGGLVCQEIARQIPCSKVIIISSFKSSSEMDWRIRLAKASRLVSLLPASLLKRAALLMGDDFFGVQNARESRLLRQIILDTDSQFVKWSVLQVLRWKEGQPHPRLLHLHGTADRVFPIGLIQQAVPVAGGGHFMIVDKAPQISALLLKALREDMPSY